MKAIKAAVVGAAVLVGPLAFGGSFNQQCTRPGQGGQGAAAQQSPAAQTSENQLGATLGPDTGTQNGIGSGSAAASGVGTAMGSGGAGTSGAVGEPEGGATSCHCQPVPGAANNQAPGAQACIRTDAK